MAAPMRVGVLNDMSDGPPRPADVERWLRLAIDELIEAGRLDRDVEFVHSFGLGLPSGTAAAVERAFAELVEQDVLVVVGPAIGDNALVATPVAERYRVPTINWAGSERARSEYMFHLQVGSHEDESLVLARHLAAIGARRVGVVHDRSPIGRRHVDFLLAEAEVLGLARRRPDVGRPARGGRHRRGRPGAHRRSRRARLSRPRVGRARGGACADRTRLGGPARDEHRRHPWPRPRVRPRDRRLGLHRHVLRRQRDPRRAARRVARATGRRTPWPRRWATTSAASSPRGWRARPSAHARG